MESKGFTIIPNKIFDLDLSKIELSVLIALYSFENKELGYAFPSYINLKERTKINDDRTLIKAINRLEEKFYIKKEVIKGRGAKYYILISYIDVPVKVQVQENYSTCENTVTDPVKIQEEVQENYSTTNTNINTNINTIYSSSVDEIRDIVKKSFNIDRVLELYSVMKKSIPNVEEYEIWKEIESILTYENDISSNNKKLDKEINVTKKKSVKSRDFKWKSKEYEEAFKEIWAIYPNKRGVANAKRSINKLLDHYSKEELMRAVKRYDSECKGKEIKYIKIGSTFFNSGYEDYLDENYISLDTSSTKKEYKPKSDNFD